jgi:hypothetical protein
MRERRPVPEQQVEPRSERSGGSLQAREARQLASQMGNVAFTALARSLTHQPGAGQGPTIGPDGTLEFPPEHIGPSGEEPTVGPDGILEFPPDYIGPTEGPTAGPDGILEFPADHIGPTEGPTVGPDGILEFPPDHIGPGDEGSGGETIEFPPDHITPDGAGAGAAAGAAGNSAG